ncbi:MAG: 4-alpha-glucanotransferase [Oscillospiraceae bacterium]|nr:4-alpha-glucanotransferase [Oscillospiraceae bacterium]
MKRSCGVLLPIASLPSRYGIGSFSESAYNFVDWLSDSGQTYWQILPLGPVGYGDSPYQSFSTFAGNPYFISLESLIEKGLLTESECNEADFGVNEESIDYEKLYINRYPLLKKAYGRANLDGDKSYKNFIEENNFWLEDYALYMALKEMYNGKEWTEWEPDIKLRNTEAINYYKTKLAEKTGFHKFLQYEFYSQWKSLKEYANNKGIQIIGDIPIYVAFDSADTWSDPHLFQLDCNNEPLAVAGCPPDGFSETGQLWGNPLYDWSYHKETGYKWWISRLKQCFSLYDVVRIDHFRGFDEYYSIPYGAKTAVNGHWEKGPGMDLFREVRKILGDQKVIAEDLGFMTDSVRELVKESGFPGMKVLEFAFDSRDSGCRNDYLPHNYNKNCVAYTGTHDNQTIVSWFDTISEEEQTMARDYLCDYYTPEDKLNKVFISLLMRSSADTVIIPMQDYLGYDDSSRINTPSTLGNNWKWRMKKDVLTDELKDDIKKISVLYGRNRNY